MKINHQITFVGAMFWKIPVECRVHFVIMPVDFTSQDLLNWVTDLKLARRKAKLVEAVIRQWIADKTVTQEEGERLLGSVEIVSFDWKRLAKYSFWISLICIVTAVGAILADEALMALLARIFRAPNIIKCLVFAGIASAMYYLGLRRRRKSLKGASRLLALVLRIY